MHQKSNLPPPIIIEKQQILLDNCIIFDGERIFNFDKIKKYFDVQLDEGCIMNKLVLNRFCGNDAAVKICVHGNNHFVYFGHKNKIVGHMIIVFSPPNYGETSDAKIFIGNGNIFNGDIYFFCTFKTKKENSCWK